MPKKQKSAYRYHPLGFVDTQLSLGSHLCCFYEDEEQQMSVLRPFLSSGIRNGEKCISIGASDLSLQVKAELATEFDVRETMEKRALEFIEEVDLRVSGELDAKKVLRFIKKLVAQTLKEGWSSCRIAGEWSWQLQSSQDRENWLEYEAMLNMALPELPAIIICQYNVDEITGRFMMDIMRTHPMVILSGSLYENDYYVEPQEFLQERISGTEHIH